jgi:hypothetical protein
VGTDGAIIDRPRAAALGTSLLLVAGLALCGLAIAARLLTINVSTFDADEYAFALVAREILEGRLPYSGVFDDKPAGLSYVVALAEWFGNRSLASVHALGLVCASVASLLVYAMGRELRLALTACVALAALFGMEVLVLGGWPTMSELVVAPLICAANLLILRRRPRGWTVCAVVGLIFGAVGQMSYLALPGLALTALGLLWPGSIRQAFLRAVAIGAGFALATALIWLPQILTGDWLPYMQDQLHFYRHYRVNSRPFSQVFNGFLAPALDIGIPLVAVAALKLRDDGLRTPLPAAFWPMALQFAGMVFAACASNRYYPHYLILALPALAALIALLLAASPPGRVWLATAILLIWGGAAGFLAVRDLPDRLAYVGIGQRASQLVDRLVGPGRRLFVFDETPAIYLLSRSETVGRYVFPNDYLATCGDGVAEMASESDYVAQSLRARPDLILSGSLCATDLDVDGMYRRAGYVLVGKVRDGSREIDAYAPAGTPPAHPVKSAAD